MCGLVVVLRNKKNHNQLYAPKVSSKNENQFHKSIYHNHKLLLNSIQLDFIQSKKYPSWTPVHRVVENAESAPFKQYFATWRDIGMQHTRLIRAAKDIDSDSGMEDEFDANEIRALKKSGGRALGFMPDGGEGDVEIWRIDNNNPVSIKPTGILFGSKAYVLKYHYKKSGEEGFVIYYWQVCN